MTEKQFKGVVVPMVTPLTKTGRTDVPAVRRIMKLFARNGISPLVLGTTGESALVGAEESLRFVKTAVESRGKGQKVYAGLVGKNTADVVALGKAYAAEGVDAVVSTLPSYYILTEDQMRRYYLTLADSINAPVLMYNIKATTQMSIPLSLSEELSHHPNIAGLKDSERDEQRLADSIAAFRDRPDFSFFCGWGAKGAASLEMGADGIVPSTANIVPELYSELYSAYLAGDFAEADRLQALTDQVGAAYQKGRTLGESLAALKVLMGTRKLCGPAMMAPLTPLAEDEAQKVVSQFKALGL